ncbi:hypothetical protein [Paracoccus contaminans]|nr:hypothetical protein [Paracoccus contaminans]
MADKTDAGQMPGNSYIPQARGLGKPVDRSQERYRPSPHYARQVPPHVDAGGTGAAGPEHSLTSRVLVYGGAAVGAAALTAAAIMGVRKIADLVTGDDEIEREAERAADRARDRVRKSGSRGGAVPRFAEMTEREREAMRARARARAAGEDDLRARLRAEALENRRPQSARPDHAAGQARIRPARGPAPQRRAGAGGLGLLGDIEHTAQSLTRNLNGVVGAVGSAMTAFRSVAEQAEGIVRQFHDTAEGIRGFLGNPNRGAASRAGSYRRPSRRDVVDLRDDQDAGNEARAHRL